MFIKRKYASLHVIWAIILLQDILFFVEENNSSLISNSERVRNRCTRMLADHERLAELEGKYPGIYRLFNLNKIVGWYLVV